MPRGVLKANVVRGCRPVNGVSTHDGRGTLGHGNVGDETVSSRKGERCGPVTGGTKTVSMMGKEKKTCLAREGRGPRPEQLRRPGPGGLGRQTEVMSGLVVTAVVRGVGVRPRMGGEKPSRRQIGGKIHSGSLSRTQLS